MLSISINLSSKELAFLMAVINLSPKKEFNGLQILELQNKLCEMLGKLNNFDFSQN